MNIFDDIEDDSTSLIKTLLYLSVKYHIENNNVTDAEKIELLLLNKYVTTASLSEIFEILDFDVKEDTISIVLTQELINHIEKEYQKYKTLNIKNK